MGGQPGDIFEIIQNGHIFLKFLFFLNIKKKKTRPAPGNPAATPAPGSGSRPYARTLGPGGCIFCWKKSSLPPQFSQKSDFPPLTTKPGIFTPRTIQTGSNVLSDRF